MAESECQGWGRCLRGHLGYLGQGTGGLSYMVTISFYNHRWNWDDIASSLLSSVSQNSSDPRLCQESPTVNSSQMALGVPVPNPSP